MMVRDYLSVEVNSSVHKTLAYIGRLTWARPGHRYTMAAGQGESFLISPLILTIRRQSWWPRMGPASIAAPTVGRPGSLASVGPRVCLDVLCGSGPAAQPSYFSGTVLSQSFARPMAAILLPAHRAVSLYSISFRSARTHSISGNWLWRFKGRITEVCSLLPTAGSRGC